MFLKILKEIEKYSNIVIARHIGVDPDAMASEIALRDTIKLNYPEKNVYAVGTGGAKFKFLGSLDNPEIKYEETLLITVDVPDKKRVDCIKMDDFKQIIKIDHHPFIEKFSDLEYIDEKASSVCQIIMEMIYELNLKSSNEIMEKLFLGLVSDTNRFLFSNSTYKTFEIVSRVIKDYNLDIASLYYPLYERPLNEIKLFGYEAENMNLTKNGVGYFIVTNDILKKFNVDVAASGNMINNFNNVKELLVWIGITEDTKNKLYKVNIRSRGPIINEIAEKYNGGGHKLASGAKLYNKEDIEKIINDLDNECLKYIKEEGLKYED